MRLRIFIQIRLTSLNQDVYEQMLKLCGLRAFFHCQSTRQLDLQTICTFIEMITIFIEHSSIHHLIQGKTGLHKST